jgi:hypothetical protein
VRPGDDFHIEWGAARNINKVLDVGVSGYCHWQVTSDTGTAAVNPGLHDRYLSIGPEVNYLHKNSGLFFQVRYQFEFEARNRSEGRNLVFSIVKVLEPGMFGYHKYGDDGCGESTDRPRRRW